MGQTIEMGPFAFELERTEQHSFYDGMEIHVMVRIVEDKSAPFTNTFDDFLGYWTIRDAAGNSYDCYMLKPLSGDRRSSSQWAAVFRVFTDASFMGVRDPEHIGKQASDFVLTIENPLQREGQPRLAVVQLR